MLNKQLHGISKHFEDGKNYPKKALNKLQIYVSILDIDFWYLQSVVRLLKKTLVDGLHYDVMDGYFVEDISFGSRILKSISSRYHSPIDVHLMINDPVLKHRKYCQDADTIIFHFESTYYREINNLLLDIKSKCRRVGIAISPKTNIEQVFEYCENCDEILIMGVVPGKGGQKFIKKTLKKIKKLATFLTQQELTKQVVIAVDGGVDFEIAKLCYAAGARKVIIGSSFFKAENQIRYVEMLHSIRG